MSLFVVTVKQTRVTNGIRLEQGMSVEVPSNSSNPLLSNGGHEVQEAFLRKYGIDLKKVGGGSVSGAGSNLEVRKVN